VPGNASSPSLDGVTQMGQLLAANDPAGLSLPGGRSLVADPGKWSNRPTSLRYHWFSCDADGLDCPDIPGATGPTHVLRVADVGRYVGVEVIAGNAIGDSEPAASFAFGPV